MRSHAIVTAVGADRLGIVDDISKEILNVSCNIEESRMALLGGDFAALLLVSGEMDAIERLIREAPAFGTKLGLAVQARTTSAPSEAVDALPYLLESASFDSPGIVHSIAAVLRRAGVNIAAMETDTAPAPWTGAPMFTMRARIAVPRTVSIATLRRDLMALEGEFNLDLTLSSAATVAAER
jgi:glycine cleavage system transcriptional repressor